ncbi:UNVERIFIED_CONTAM: Retrovirus-related Pol polyprotein from transposon RE2 [Sesamum angustifolium]|uniref:Retrovirus-related Pol polyprotein from transposon RE2 n=1 Tax=Sesamum angustifolium TaxID=2727405 RepID=A0AAW2PF48_9LAMI
MLHGPLVLILDALSQGIAFFLGTSLVSWKTKKQATVSRSSAEAEYRSMASTVCELLWITYLLCDFGVSVSLPIPFWCDNQAALHITANPVFHERTKTPRHRLSSGARSVQAWFYCTFPHFRLCSTC